MTTATPKPAASPANGFDPDQYRMTVGEHLEELRWRFILALLGFGVVLIGCLFFGTDVVSTFCAPLVNTLAEHDINPQLVTDEVSEGFMVFIQISVISAAALASPWMLYQLWLFVAAGLYPHERKYVTRYLPLSISLLVGGMLFVYFLVLPWTLDFFITFSTAIPLKLNTPAHVAAPTTAPTSSPSGQSANLHRVPLVRGDPPKPQEGDLWMDTTQQRLKLFFNGQVRVISFSADNLLAPEIKLSTYIRLVIAMLITFGLSFQLPLVVLALARIGIVEVEQLGAVRKYVYFAMTILAAVITPGDVITATVALVVPLCLLYELGIWLARSSSPKPTPQRG